MSNKWSEMKSKSISKFIKIFETNIIYIREFKRNFRLTLIIFNLIEKFNIY